MKRASLTREEIWAELHRMMRHEAASLAVPELQLPMPIRLDAPDSTGCNWCVEYFSSARQDLRMVERVVEGVRARINMV